MNSLERLHEALETLGIKSYGRVKQVADITGYSYPQVSAILSNKSPLNERFVKSICSKLMISEDWINTGEGDPIQIKNLVAEDMVSYEGLPEPVRKTIELMMDNPARAWEIYAVVLERVESFKVK